MNVLGIDPGLEGGWAILDDAGRLVAIGDIPTIGEGSKRVVAAALLGDTLRRYQPALAVIESVAAMPKQGVSSVFRFGRAVGTVEGAVSVSGISLIRVTPGVWKKHYGLDATKENSRALALEMWPDHAADFARKKDHGRAEAALIGAWGVRADRLAGGLQSEGTAHG